MYYLHIYVPKYAYHATLKLLINVILSFSHSNRWNFPQFMSMHNTCKTYSFPQVLSLGYHQLQFHSLHFQPYLILTSCMHACMCTCSTRTHIRWLLDHTSCRGSLSHNCIYAVAVKLLQ